MTTVRITHFSDILCVWAYIGQIRVTELQSNFPREVAFDFRYFTVFGDVRAKMETQWGERGGREAYANHVHEVAAGFDHVNLCPDAWRRNVPTSSLPAHLLISAVRLLGNVGYRVLEANIRELLRHPAAQQSWC